MNSAADAVYFQPGDYASPLRRVIGAVIDLFAIILLLSVVWTGISFKYVPREVRAMPRSPEKQQLMNKHMAPIVRPVFFGWLAAAFMYHVGLSRTRLGTLGHAATGTRIIDAAGHAPSWKALTKRFFLAMPMVLVFGLSYLHCGRSSRRQAAHDLPAGCWVVRKRAAPAGPARIAYQTRMLGPWVLTMIDVEPPAERTTPTNPVLHPIT